MFTKTPCKHPVIFLKDVSAPQMAILLKYMYLGQISVKKEVTGSFKSRVTLIDTNTNTNTDKNN
jgi:hypothetical protein